MNGSTFELASAGRVIFGRGAFARVGDLAAPLGARALVVTGRSALKPQQAQERGFLDQIRARLGESGISIVHYLVRGEPAVGVIDEGARLALASGCDLVIGLGGGSALDAAKAIAGLMTNGGEALDYLEIVGGGRELERSAAPYIAIPTTAGTGSEVTRNAVLTLPRARVKASIRSAYLLPAIALVDPDLTLGLPPQLTASTGLDALTQLIEGYLTPRASPMTDLFALEGIFRSARSLLTGVRDGSNEAARTDLALASLLGGLTLANAGLGAVHGIAAPLGGRHPVPHGVACALLLSQVFDTNLRALRSRDSTNPALARMDRVGEILLAAAQNNRIDPPLPGSGMFESLSPNDKRLMPEPGFENSSAPAPGKANGIEPSVNSCAPRGQSTKPARRTGIEDAGEQVPPTEPTGRPEREGKWGSSTHGGGTTLLPATGLRRGSGSGADAAVELLRQLVAHCDLPSLASFGVGPEDVPALVGGAMRASSMKGNPVELSAEEIAETINATLKYTVA